MDEETAKSTLDKDAATYAIMPPKPGEFSNDEESLAWEAEGWSGLIEATD